MPLKPSVAMVLAAGLGTRMRPLTDHLPKPLVPLKGRPLIDHVLDRIAAAGIASAVVNVHHHANLLIEHLARRTAPRITISDERDALLDTGGGVRRAMPLLGAGPFFVHNSDSVWIETATDNLSRHAAHWRQADMDGLLLLAPTATSIGYGGRGDFALASDGRIARRAAGASAPFVFAGVSILHPRIMDGAPEGRFSLNASFDQAIARRRLFGLPLEGLWMHVGTPEAIVAAERAMDGAAVG